MKKISAIFSILLLPFLAKAQKITQYTATNGVTYHIHDIVKLGLGSAPNGTFMYLQIGGWGSGLVYDPNKGPDQLNIGRAYANTGVIIKKIKLTSINGVAKYYFVVGGGNITNYELMIDDAIQACEVVPCASTNPATTIVQQSDDNLDKLKKLKALLDSGAITQAEYDQQKKKLLNE